jgi:ankyrin repeat protein
MSQEPVFAKLVDAAVGGRADVVSQLLASDRDLAIVRSGVECFVDAATHQLYAGDTALHMAAAAFQRAVAEILVRSGADSRARNRRGAEPLHYAADTNHWAPAAQRETIEYLLSAGADPNAIDSDGTAPLHRAVRTRSSEAVRALLAGGADVRKQNGGGSTPLHLAVQDTGRGGAGSERAREEQRKIIAILLQAGAKGSDSDGRGRTVLEVASTDLVRDVLTGPARSNHAR